MLRKIGKRNRDYASAELDDWKLDAWLAGSCSNGKHHIIVQWRKFQFAHSYQRLIQRCKILSIV